MEKVRWRGGIGDTVFWGGKKGYGVVSEKMGGRGGSRDGARTISVGEIIVQWEIIANQPNLGTLPTASPFTTRPPHPSTLAHPVSGCRSCEMT